MSQFMTFAPITVEQLEVTIASSSGADLVAVRLTNGDVLLGEIHQYGEWDQKTVNLAFNMPDGKRYGTAQITAIPITSISSVRHVPLNEASRPKLSEEDPEMDFLKKVGMDVSGGIKLPVHNYPNPLAIIIYEHNISIIQRHKFRTLHLVEESLAQDGIPTEGIHFDNDFLLYADWDFFNTQSKGGATIAASPIPGLIQIEKSIQMSPEQQVMQRLRLSTSEQIRKKLYSSIGNYAVLRGALLVPDPAQDEEIEGELSYLYQIAVSRNGEIHPILIKAQLLKFPRGFLDRISSELVFYGEFLPAPVAILGKTYKSVLLLRALAYLNST